MDQTVFAAWLEGIGALTEPQRLVALGALTVASAETGCEPVAVPQCGQPSAVQTKAPPLIQAREATAIALLGQRRVDICGCPHCDSRDVVLWGSASEMPRYRCKACKRTFNALTKTPLARLRKTDKWAAQTAAMIEATTTAKAAARCGVHYTTAFRWRHRFLAALSGDKPNTNRR